MERKDSPAYNPPGMNLTDIGRINQPHFDACPKCGTVPQWYHVTYGSDGLFAEAMSIDCRWTSAHNHECDYTFSTTDTATARTFEGFGKLWNVAVAACTPPEPAPAPEPVREPRVNSRLSDADVAALLGAKRHLSAGYEIMNLYAKDDLRNYYGRPMDASAVMAEAYGRMAPAVAFVNEVLAGVDTKAVMTRLTDYISLELAEQRDELETTRANLYEEVDELKALYEGRLAEVEGQAEKLAEQRVAEILAERDTAATVIRRGKGRKVRVD